MPIPTPTPPTPPTHTPTTTTFILGDYQTNCFIITPQSIQAGQPCWIVDCGLDPDEMLDFVKQHQLKPTAILLTHAHLDHIAGVDRALSRFGKLPISIHRAEIDFCEEPTLNLSALIGMPTTCTRPDHALNDGDLLTLGDPAAGTWRVMHTPGHSPGGICFIHDQSKQAIVGDTLFACSIGRFDFPTSNPDDLRRSIKRIMTLPDDMTIHPGHGSETTIARERKTNPFVIQGF